MAVRRRMPKTLKNSFQNVCASARSRVSSDHSRANVMARFRTRLREVHPDHGGDERDASQRIGELGEARRILLR